MLVISSIAGPLAAVLGHYSANTVPRWFGYESTNTSGMMAVCAGLLFAAAWMFSPTEGLVVRAVQRRGGIRHLEEDDARPDGI